MNELKSKIQNEALLVIKNYSKAGVVMSMGLGKTLLGLMDMEQNLNSFSSYLVVAPKRSIFDSWIDDANKFGFGHLLNHIKFTTYLSLNKQSKNFQKVYLDECHNLLNTHEDWLSEYDGNILGLTGTPPTLKDKEKYDLINRFCPIVYNKDVNFAVDNKILNDYCIYVHSLDLDKVNRQKFGKGYMTEYAIYNFWTSKLQEVQNQPYPNHKLLQYFSIMRMKALQSFKSKTDYAIKLLNLSQDKTIVFANTKKQADQVCSNSYYSGKKSAEKNLDYFKSGKISKLSCVLQLNEGVNIPNLKNGIIMHAYGNNRKTSQRIGRLLRLNPNDKSAVHILCYRNTVDEKWIKDSLQEFDPSKIIYV